MMPKQLYASPYLTLVSLAAAAWAAPFQNLEFEDANPSSVVGNIGPTTDLLPAWRVRSDSFEWPEILYNSVLPGFGWAALLPKENISEYPVNFPVYGDYGLALAPSFTFFTLPPVPRSITVSQTGDLQPDVQRITFINWGGPVELRLNGEFIPITIERQEIWPTTLDIVRFVSADVSAFAGQTVELSFVATWAADAPPIRGLDSIRFVVPEPSTNLFLGLGGTVVIALGRNRSWRFAPAARWNFTNQRL